MTARELASILASDQANEMTETSRSQADDKTIAGQTAGPRSKGLRHRDLVMVTGAGNVLILMALLPGPEGP